MNCVGQPPPAVRGVNLRVVRFLRERLKSAENPRQWGKPLHGNKRGRWRYRVGDFRLICEIQDERIAVLVLEVTHRKDG
jgi:mRNA interferase RelE/StbE